MIPTTPLTDSTDIVGDGQALRERAAADGYILVRGLLPRAAVVDAARELADTLAAAGPSNTRSKRCGPTD